MDKVVNRNYEGSGKHILTVVKDVKAPNKAELKARRKARIKHGEEMDKIRNEFGSNYIGIE